MSINSIKVDNSTLPKDYSPHEIKDADSARAASIHLLFSHVADFHKIIVKIIAEKYGIKEDDIYGTIVNHPDYVNMTVNPVIYGLSHISQEDVDRAGVGVVKNEVIEPTTVKVKAIRKKKADIITDEVDIVKPEKDAPPQKMKIVRKKKIVAEKIESA